MIRRLLSLGALAAMSLCFAAALHLWFRFTRERCGAMEYMSAGNCYDRQIPNMDFLFGGFAIVAIALAALVLLPRSWSDELWAPRRIGALLAILGLWVVAAAVALYLSWHVWSITEVLGHPENKDSFLRYPVFGAVLVWAQLYVAVGAWILRSRDT